LQSQGTPLDKLHIILKGIVEARILYALPAWGTHLHMSKFGRINAFLKRAHKIQMYFLGESCSQSKCSYTVQSAVFSITQLTVSTTFCFQSRPFEYSLCNSGYVLPQCKYQATYRVVCELLLFCI